jgi:hypothetical protein
MLFYKKLPDGKGRVGRCVVVMQQPILLSPKFGTKSSHIFIVAVKHHGSMQN